MTEPESIRILTWVGIALCVSHSAMFSGLNLALFGLSRLNLEVEVAAGNPKAVDLLHLRKDSNFLLATILWGNVAANCLLTILSDSVLAGVAAFLFSTVLITVAGEICPQAYFSRNALHMASLLSPMLRFYQFVLYPITRPTGLALDWWLGKEGIEYYEEDDLLEILRRHVHAEESDVDHSEGRGAINFLTMDDIPAGEEGEPINPESVVSLPMGTSLPIFPEFEKSALDPFIRSVLKSHEKWVIITNPEDEPVLVLDADALARDVVDPVNSVSPYKYCSRPIVIRDPHTPLGDIITRFKTQPKDSEDDVIDEDIALVWNDSIRRVITGADILGRLLRGIALRGHPPLPTGLNITPESAHPPLLPGA